MKRGPLERREVAVFGSQPSSKTWLASTSAQSSSKNLMVRAVVADERAATEEFLRCASRDSRFGVFDAYGRMVFVPSEESSLHDPSCIRAAIRREKQSEGKALLSHPKACRSEDRRKRAAKSSHYASSSIAEAKLDVMETTAGSVAEARDLKVTSMAWLAIKRFGALLDGTFM
eukprot:TRINITY_DN8444_c0_g1_i2.p1 TRINITY_DN8444_c0_g1~~TRINITY_DN8444_c0_g1_i2.p1  ORF type:complete len:173 (-),score=30.78 TRINITY_DN8444_c0_g1_i2:920-1438(-)